MLDNLDTRAISIGAIVIMIAISAFFSIKKRTMFKRLQTLMAQEKWDEFYALLDSKLAAFLYPEYNRTYLKLNSYLMREDTKSAKKIFDDLLERKLPKMQRIDLVIKAFNFYISQNNGKRAKELLAEIEANDDEKMKPVAHECRLMYDTVIGKSSANIEELEREIEGADTLKRGRLEYLLALQYGNKGDKAKHDEYLERAANDTYAPGDGQ